MPKAKASAPDTTPTKSNKKASKASQSAKTVETPPPNIIAENTTFMLSIPWEKVQESWAKALQSAQAQMKLDGFRKGKAPLRLIEQNVDRQYLVQKTVEFAIPPIYQEHLEKNSLQPLTEPDIHPKSLEPNSAWEFEVSIAQRPEIDITGYDEIVKKVKKEHELWKEEAQGKTEKSEKKTTEKEAKEEKKAESPMTPEQKKDAQVGTLVAALLEKIFVPVPELLLRRETEYQLHRLEHELEHLKMSVKDFLQHSGKTLEDLQQDYAARALGNLQVELLLGAIIRAQDLQVEAEEVAEALQKRYPNTEKGTSPKITTQDVTYVQSVLLKQKALDHVLGL